MKILVEATKHGPDEEAPEEDHPLHFWYSSGGSRSWCPREYPYVIRTYRDGVLVEIDGPYPPRRERSVVRQARKKLTKETKLYSDDYGIVFSEEVTI